MVNNNICPENSNKGAIRREENSPLGNITEFVSTSLIDARKIAYKRQEKMHEISTGRVTACLKIRSPKSDGIKVKKSKTNRCHYSGLVVCGSFWVCPVCSARISYKRAEELYQVNLSGFELSMVTTTLQHSKTDKLESLMSKLSAAMRLFRNGRAYIEQVKKYGIIGTITGTEIRYGKNGYHPHKHTLFISEKPLDTDFIKWAKKRWVKCLAKVSGSATYESGLDVVTQLDHNAKTYITKLLDTKTGLINDQHRWTITDEISSSNKKISNVSRHPFELLDDKLPGDLELFKDYAYAVKGYQSLRWSPGLKKRFQVKEIPDKDLAIEDEIPDEILFCINLFAWIKILKLGIRFDVIREAEKGGLPAVEILLKNHGIELISDSELALECL